MVVFAYASSNGGSFVVGDLSATGKVTFWGTKWSKTNKLSGFSYDLITRKVREASAALEDEDEAPAD